MGSSGNDALMSMQLYYQYYNPNTEELTSSIFYGVAKLAFSSTSAGTISYADLRNAGKVPPPVSFSKFSTTYDSAAGTLTVAMTVTIAAKFACTFPVTALYRMP
jgi:hypothetical protein